MILLVSLDRRSTCAPVIWTESKESGLCLLPLVQETFLDHKQTRLVQHLETYMGPTIAAWAGKYIAETAEQRIR